MRRLIRKEEGQSYVEFLWVIPIFTLFAAGVLVFGQVLYCQLACHMASYDGARAAAEALLSGAGMHQGVEAAYQTLEGFHIANPRGAAVSVYSVGMWARTQEIHCTVRYNLALSHLPFVGMFSGVFPSGLEVSSDTALRVESYRSMWR